MAANHPPSMSTIEAATGCAERWRRDLRAVRSMFRQHKAEAARAEVDSRSPSQNPEQTLCPCPIQENATMSMATTAQLEIAPPRPLLVQLAIAAACAALADWLFYGWPVGISLALFFAALGVTAVACNGIRALRRVQIAMTAVFTAGLIALIEDAGMLSVTWSALATGLFVIVLTAEEASSWQRHLFDTAMTPLRGPFQFAGDVVGALRRTKSRTPGWRGSLVAWIVPLIFFAVFLALFSSANPLIENRLMRIDLRALFNQFDAWRISFWIMIACVIWPLLRRRVRRKPVRAPDPRTASFTDPIGPDHLLGEKAMSRSLILFNLLFALQTGLDLTYLWGGMNLPDGMSHAEYAHRGAYPLVATALLAAGFVLVAMRPGGPAEKSRLIRPLVLLWTGQNILLVISSIFRLDLYVAAFSLTYLRLAASIWMGLVAAGLLLMLIQIFLRKPNSWLLATNAATLALVLYGCCFVNAPRLVASYNVEHCREVGGTGPNLDLQYLGSLGPQVLPVVEAHRKDFPALLIDMEIRFPRTRDSLARSENWRSWGFRSWRLRRYLANNPDTPQNSSDGGKG
jgi:Domain of unknown function (DUF4153)